MIKKLVIYGVIGVVGWHAVKDTKLGTKIRTEIAGIRKSVDENTSPQKDLDRIKTDLKLLDLDIQKQIKPLAAERVRVMELREQVSDMQAKQVTAKETLQARAALIKGATDFVTFENRKPVSVALATAELEESVRRYKANEKSIESMEAALVARERIKAGLEKQLDAMKAQKTELETAVVALEAEVGLLKLQQIESRHQTDETRLARVKESIRELKTKVAVQREELKLLPAVVEAQASTPTASRSIDDIMAPLGGSKPSGKPGAMPPAID